RDGELEPCPAAPRIVKAGSHMRRGFVQALQERAVRDHERLAWLGAPLEAHLLACVEALRLAQIPVGPELGSTTRLDHFQPRAHEPDRGGMAGRRSAVEIDALPISAHQGAGVGPRSEVEAGVEKASQALA